VYDTLLTIEQILTLLADAPVRLFELTRGLSDSQLVIPPCTGGWSTRDVLAHLRACSDMWGNYIVLILSQENPTFQAVNPSTLIKQTDYLQQEFRPSLQAFTNQCAELLDILKPLAPEAWPRTVTSMTAGRPRQRSVYTHAQWLANHERSHIRQIKNIANAVMVTAYERK